MDWFKSKYVTVNICIDKLQDKYFSVLLKFQDVNRSSRNYFVRSSKGQDTLSTSFLAPARQRIKFHWIASASEEVVRAKI